ncbi:MAG: TetR/AcrR family transcriptional regulator C-terminal domain-containing protein [Thermoplasmata archaeon]
MRQRTVRKRPNVTPEVVVRAALELLDAEGLEGVTFRAVASKLGIQAPALYWHFENKKDLMDDLAQTILIEGGVDAIQPPSKAGDWKTWLGQAAHTLRKALVAHRDGGRVVAGASFSRAKALAKLDITSTKVLKDAGFGTVEASLATATVVDYVWGFVIEEQEGRGPAPSGAAASGASRPSGPGEKLPGNAFGVDPSMVGLFREAVKELNKFSDVQLFDWGLQVVLDGLTSARKTGRRASIGPTV